MIRFYFNPSAYQALAKEFRRASWGVAVVMGGLIFKDDGGFAIVIGGAGWLLLQAIAFTVESLKETSGDQQ